MRRKKDPQSYLSWTKTTDLKIVKEYESKYNHISEILDEVPEVLAWIAEEIKPLSRGKNKRVRDAVYTSENLLRAMIVHVLEGRGLRDTIVQISHSEFLRGFLRLGPRRVMDFTFLDKAIKLISPRTWKRINELLSRQADATGKINVSMLRMDTTVVAANIHYPTDCSLLWDSWRVLSRCLRRAQKEDRTIYPHRFHDRKIKRLHAWITRYAASPSASRRRMVKRSFKTLIERVNRMVGIAEEFCSAFGESLNPTLLGSVAEIRRYLPAIRTVCETAERAQLRDEKVPACERVFSLFEEHVELIKRGKRSTPVEFGHMVLLAETPEKFIVQYDVMKRRVPDQELAKPTIDRHEKCFGEPPAVVTADTGFCGKADYMEQLRQRVDVLAIPKRVADWGGELLRHWRNFRAGIEGTISVLKRAFGLFRCLFRGFNSFECSIGLSVFCHNLVVLTAQ